MSRLARLRQVASGLRPRPADSATTEAWALPPERGPLRPDVRAVVLAGRRLTDGLAAQWRQSVLPDLVGAVGGQELTDADLLLVEYVDGAVPGHEDLVVSAALRSATRAGVPVVAWATAGGPPAGVTALVEAGARVFVADPAHLDAWKSVSDEVTELPVGVDVRRTAAGVDRSGAVLVVDGPVDPRVAGAVAADVVKAVRPLDGVSVHLRDPDAPVSRVLRGRASHPVPLDEAALLVDAPRHRVEDVSTLLDAGALRTPVVTLDRLPVPADLEAKVVRARDARALRSEIIARVEQPELRDREGLALHRAVQTGHRLDDRVDLLLDGIAPPRLTDRSVSAIVPTNRPHEIDNVLANVGRQSHRDVELVLVLHGIDLDRADLVVRAEAAGVPHLTVVDAPRTATLGTCMNLGLGASSGAFVAKMDDDNHYGTHYLTDLLDAGVSSGAGIVGKWAHYVWLRSTGAVVLRYPETEHSYVRRIQGGSMLFDGDVVRGLRFSDIPRAVDSDILDRAISDGVKIWSADRFNFVSVRGLDRHAHTWTVDDASFMTAHGRLEFYGDPRQHVEV
ncbi:glycosyltransferase family 2 protein [Nocardioides sp. Root140]|uniref:glycosyltransferase family 2 protein n=1 Tax=Nocardioides sp. Root140 TaxID=1736460 RepID=UPI0006F68096|nr:glycosyltransferase [Nocardioides sp. Root140]KQY55521.1 hypothetical protein ASD30_16635 [Nocardioides sp. Root140]